MDDGHHGQEPQAHEYGSGLIYMLCGLRGTAILIGPDWSLLDDCLALRCQTLQPARHRKRRGAWVVFDGTAYAHVHIGGTP
jgi:hypothetical protein